jgi:hypothetical protein
MKLYVIPQGYADAACLVYAILNSLKTFLAPDQTTLTFFREHRASQKLEKVLAIAPSPLQFLGGDVVMELPQPIEQEAIHNFVGLAFRVFNTRQHRFSVERITLSQLRRKRDYTRTVVLFQISNADTLCGTIKNHWVCAVDRSEVLLLACSCALYWCDDYLRVLKQSLNTE